VNETEWTKKICDLLKKQMPAIVTPLSASSLSVHGIPDRHITTSLWQGLIEFKGVSTPITKSQLLFHRNRNKLRPCTCWIWRQVSSDNNKYVRLQYVRSDGSVADMGVVTPKEAIEKIGLFSRNRTY
jgi:hypothetical protein